VAAGESSGDLSVKKYGDAADSQIIYLKKFQKNVDDGLTYVTGQNLKICSEMENFYAD